MGKAKKVTRFARLRVRVRIRVRVSGVGLRVSGNRLNGAW